MVPEIECSRCHKRQLLCFCHKIQQLKTRHKILILQHPQEPDKELGSATIANLALENSILRVGLSWSNLSKALNEPAVQSNWGVLYLGGRGPQQKPGDNIVAKDTARLEISTKQGHFFSAGEVRLDGIVVLDGTWAQAKTLWWRNPWLLKLKRLILTPSRPSLYGRLRREPRRECLSTIESIAETLEALGEAPEVSRTLRRHFEDLLFLWKKERLAQPPIVKLPPRMTGDKER